MANVYLPVQCGSCEKVQLLAARVGAVPSCRSCGGDTAVLPGQSYVAEDEALFTRIEGAIEPVALKRRSAEQIVATLRGVALRGESPEKALLAVVDHLPSLHFLLPALTLDPGAARAVQRSTLGRAAGMVLTIVAARLRRLESLAS